MSALTLVEAAKIAANNGEDKKAGVISMFAEKSDLLAAIPVLGIMGNSLSYTQEGDLPSTAFRGVNEGFTPSAGKFNNQKEALMAAGGDLDVDRMIIKTQGEDVRTKHEALKLKSLAVTLTDAIIAGDNSSEPREFDGLQTRISESSQKIANGNSSGGNALSLIMLDKLIDSVNSPTHLVMSRAMRRKFAAAFRSSTFPNGLFTMDGSSDGGQGFRRTYRYADLPILVGYEPNKNTAILPFSEANPGGGSAVGTSIYCLNLNAEDGVALIDNGGIDVRDLGEINESPVWRTRIEWYVSLANFSPYSRARLWGITDANIAA